MAFADRLQAVRQRNGLTQERFAEQLHVSRQAVSKWESGRGYPEVEKLLEICNRYAVTPNELFSQEVPQAAAAYPAAPKDRALQLRRWLVPVVAGLALLLTLVLGAILKGRDMDMIPVIWMAVMVLFGVLEAATVGLTSIWFVAGALGGLIVALCGGQIWLQLVVFFVVSIGCLVAARPLVMKYINAKTEPTNADRVLGSMARVTEAIDNTVPTGAVYVDGKTWSARSENGEAIAAGTLVRVRRMEGVRLFVEEEHNT